MNSVDSIKKIIIMNQFGAIFVSAKSLSVVDDDISSEKNEIDHLIFSYKATAANVCFYFIKLMNSKNGEIDKEKKLKCFKHFIYQFEALERGKQEIGEELITKDEERILRDEFQDIADTTLSFLIKKDYTEDEFYKRLWECVFSNPIIEDDEKKAVFLSEIVTDKRVPYYYIDISAAKSMSDQEFRDRSKKLFSKSAKIRFIMQYEFEQRTQQASLILKEIESLDSFEDRCVLLSRLLFEGKSGASLKSLIGALKDQ